MNIEQNYWFDAGITWVEREDCVGRMKQQSNIASSSQRRGMGSGTFSSGPHLLRAGAVAGDAGRHRAEADHVEWARLQKDLASGSRSR
jgi:hypothetical protein